MNNQSQYLKEDLQYEQHCLYFLEALKLNDRNFKKIGKLIKIKGIISSKTAKMVNATQSRFECPTCGSIIPVIQNDTKFKEPDFCGCGRKGKFRLLENFYEDYLEIVIWKMEFIALHWQTHKQN